MADEKEHKDETKAGDKKKGHWIFDQLRKHDEMIEKVWGDIIADYANPIAVRIFNKYEWLADEKFGIGVALASRIPLLVNAIAFDGNPILERVGQAVQRVGEEFREEYKRRIGKGADDATKDTVAGQNVSQVHSKAEQALADDLKQAGRVLMAISAVADDQKRGEFWGWYETLDDKQWNKFNRAIAGIPDEKLVDLANNDHAELDAFMKAIPANPEPPKGWDDLFDVFKDVHNDPELMGWVREYLTQVNDLYPPAFAENRDAFWNAALSEAKTIAKFKEIMSLMTPTTLNPSGWTDAINKFLKLQYRTSEVPPPPKFSFDRILEEEGVDLDAQLTASEDGLARARAARDAARERIGGN